MVLRVCWLGKRSGSVEDSAELEEEEEREKMKRREKKEVARRM